MSRSELRKSLYRGLPRYQESEGVELLRQDEQLLVLILYIYGCLGERYGGKGGHVGRRAGRQGEQEKQEKQEKQEQSSEQV